MDNNRLFQEFWILVRMNITWKHVSALIFKKLHFNVNEIRLHVFRPLEK